MTTRVYMFYHFVDFVNLSTLHYFLLPLNCRPLDLDLKFAGYVHHYEILTENIFGLILKNKMAATGVSF